MRNMGKKAASWTIDEDILAWIATKVGSKSEYVNNILRKARIREDEVRVVSKRMCQKCHSMIVGDGDCRFCRRD